MAKKKITRRRVIGEVAYRIERVAAAFPRNIYTLAARVDGPRAASALRDLADVLRVMEEHGPEVAWEDLQRIEDEREEGTIR